MNGSPGNEGGGRDLEEAAPGRGATARAAQTGEREMRAMEKEFGVTKEKETGEASQEDLEAYGILPAIDEEEDEAV